MSWENPRRRRRATPRRRRYSPRRYLRRFRKPKTVPLEMLVAGVGTFFTPAKEGYYSPIQHLQSGNPQGVAYNYLEGFTGINLDGGRFDFDVWKTINPLDFSRARYWKMLFLAGLIGMVRKKFVRQSSVIIRKIPIIGRWVS